MKDKDRLQLRTSSNDTIQRFIVIKFTGWFYGTRSNPIPIDNPLMTPPRKSLSLTYQMLGNNNILTLPFPHNKPDKKRVQWETHSLSHLQKDKCYAVWLINAGTSQNGDWYWTRTMELTNNQAEHVKKHKFNRPHRDKWMKPLEVELTAVNGHPHGARIYSDIKRIYGTTNVKLHEVMLTSKMYWDEQNKIPHQINELLTSYLSQINIQEFVDL